MAKLESITFNDKKRYDALCQMSHPLMTLNLFALIIVISIFQLHFQTLNLAHPIFFLMASIAPLTLVIPGIVRGTYRGAIWASFVTLIYFVAGVLNWTQPNNWAYGMSETLLSMSLFLITLMYARWKGASELPIKG